LSDSESNDRLQKINSITTKLRSFSNPSTPNMKVEVEIEDEDEGSMNEF